jgi:hypothetical protein
VVAVQVLDVMEAATVATTPQVRPALTAEVVVVAVVVEQVFLVVLVDRELLLSGMQCQVCPRQFWIQLTTLEFLQPTGSLL